MTNAPKPHQHDTLLDQIAARDDMRLQIRLVPSARGHAWVASLTIAGAPRCTATSTVCRTPPLALADLLDRIP
jgi:hypothetical protein